MALTLLLPACSKSPSAQSIVMQTSLPAVPTAVAVSQYGAGCRSANYPDEVGPPSYNVAALGKPGVPGLTSDQLAMIRRIERYVHSRSLRFAFVLTEWGPHTFIVFDPGAAGPCTPGARVLNLRGKQLYEPQIDPYTTVPDTPTMPEIPKPWFSVAPGDFYQAPAPTVWTIPVSVSRHGVGCKSTVYPYSVGPPSFSEADIGKPGVPHLSKDQLALVAQAQVRRADAGGKYVHPKTVRFAFLPGFVAFDANLGPCPPSGAGYWLLNSNSSAPLLSRAYYAPSINPYAVESPIMPQRRATP